MKRMEWIHRIRHWIGVDRAIFFTVAARFSLMAGSTLTVLLIVRFLTPVEQGYYYTLYSLVGLQVIFELGFSFVILQLAAHESVRLKFLGDGAIEGDPVAHARLASVVQKAIRWYAIAAVLMVLTLLPLGSYFFARQRQENVDVHWQWPWATVVLATALWFLMGPFFSFLEGCGQVQQVARVRFWEVLAGTIFSWIGISTRHGLFSPALFTVGSALVGASFLWKRRSLLRQLAVHPTGEHSVAWRIEVWPFQWRIAMSWLCAYLTAQIFTPVLFAARGPVEAGQMGMSMSIAGHLSSVVIAWMTTKAAPFGHLVAKGQIGELDRIYSRTLWQSLGLLTAMAAGCQVALFALPYVFPRLAQRMVAPALFSFLLLTALSRHVVQSQAMYLRAFKREPFLVQYLVVSTLTCVCTFLTARAWGAAGVAATYFACTGVIGLISGTMIFQSRRRAWRRTYELQTV